MTVMVLLVGEQQIPNLLPVRHVRPREVLLVHTERTLGQSARLRDVLSVGCQVEELCVSAYDIAEVRADLGARLAKMGWRDAQTVFNLTGGTKTMAFAAYELAVRLGSDFFYFQTDGGQSLIYRYVTAGGAPTMAGPAAVIPPSLTVDDYMRVHIGHYTVAGFSRSGSGQFTSGGLFEKAVHDALCPHVDEVLPGVHLGGAVDIDLVIRCGNQVGMAEVKAAKPSKQGIMQLTAAGGRAYLGTYTRRFLIVDRRWDGLDDLKDLAAARDISLVELPSYQADGTISDADQQQLRTAVSAGLRCRPPAGPSAGS